MIGEVTRFGLVGLLATATHIGIVVLFVEGPGASVYVANVLAWMVALIVSYCGHFGWTFHHATRSEAAHARRFPQFILVSLSGLGLNLSGIALVHGMLGFGYLLATLFGIALAVATTFLLNRVWTFRSLS